MPRHVHIGYLFIVAAILCVAVVGLAVVDHHDSVQKESWAGHWLHSHDRFEEHMDCMRRHRADAVAMAACMRIAPKSDEPASTTDPTREN